MNGNKYQVGDIVETYHYKEAKIISYDPRYPGTYGILFWILDIPKIVYGVSEREIKRKIKDNK